MIFFVLLSSVTGQVRDILGQLGARQPTCDEPVIKQGLLEIGLCTGVLGSTGLFKVDDSRCGNACTALACGLRAMGCAAEYKRMLDARGACGGALDCSKVSPVSASECENFRTYLVDKPKALGQKFGACSPLWSTLKSLAQSSFRLPPEFTENVGPCGRVCQYGTCGLFFLGCPDSQSLVNQVARTQCSGPQLQCAAFVLPPPCPTLDCESPVMDPNDRCPRCPNDCKEMVCPPVSCQAPETPIKGILSDTDPLGCCEVCRDECDFNPCRQTEPTPDFCVNNGIRDVSQIKRTSPPFVYRKVPPACCGSCVPLCNEANLDSCPIRSPLDCPFPEQQELIYGADQCCAVCQHVCGPSCTLPTCGPDEDPAPPKFSEDGNPEPDCCPTECISRSRSVVAEPTMTPEPFDYVTYSIIGGAGLCCLCLLLILLIVCLMSGREKETKEPNPLYFGGDTMMVPPSSGQGTWGAQNNGQGTWNAQNGEGTWNAQNSGQGTWNSQNSGQGTWNAQNSGQGTWNTQQQGTSYGSPQPPQFGTQTLYAPQTGFGQEPYGQQAYGQQQPQVYNGAF